MKKIPLEVAVGLLSESPVVIVVGEGVVEHTVYGGEEDPHPHPMLEGFFMEFSLSGETRMFHCDDNQEVEVEGQYMRLMESDEETVVELKLLEVKNLDES